jgi:hypothetical protein
VSPIAPALDRLCAEVAELTAQHGARVDAGALGVLDREGVLPLDPPGLVSSNRACRLFRTADGWIAVNLAREEDQELVAAWLRRERVADPWDAIAAEAPAHAACDLVADATLLGLPVSRVGEITAQSFAPPQLRKRPPSAAERTRRLRVVDLSALWAGPMCGAMLAEMGADVVKVESERRPDPTRGSTPAFFQRLNGKKSELQLDFAAPAGRARLPNEIARADILITSARPRAFFGLGLEPDAVFAANPAIVWVAITGYGWTGAAGERVAFGDDAAAAGGLVGWTAEGEPRFLGDALADPVTGLAAAAGALAALGTGGGVIVDVAMARCAAAAAVVCELRAAA